MKNKLAEIIFLLDRSGSMAGLERETIDSYNDFLFEQDACDGKTLVTTVLFDNEMELLYDCVPAPYAHLNERQYFVRGATALLDAIGTTITHIQNRIKNSSEKRKPDNIFFVITTDGMENGSREYTYREIKKMVKNQQKNEWRFIFFGANIDAFDVGKDLGIKREFTSQFKAETGGIKAMMYELRDFIGIGDIDD